MGSSKEKLITSEELYKKLIYDTDANIDTRKCEISYIDRIKNSNICVPFHEWLPLSDGGDIPWHRVHQILYNKKVMWDRDKRLYDPSVTKAEIPLSLIPLYYFDESSNKWIIYNKTRANLPLPDKISVVSYNVLFDLFKTNPPLPPIQKRIPLIIKLIEELECQPEIICFQEVTPQIRDLILSRQFIRKNYYTTQHKLKKYGQIILTKYPPLSQNKISFKNNPMKDYFQMTFKTSDGGYLDIYNVHLTSSNQSNSDSKRQAQLDQLRSDISYGNKSIIVGDFNTSESIRLYDLRDVWEIMHPCEEGYTYQPSRNTLANINSISKMDDRYDRCLISNLLPEKFNIIGTEPIDSIYLSDHYGIHIMLDTTKTYTEDVFPVYMVQDKLKLRPGTALDIILPPYQWELINKYRKLYDTSYLSWSPHVTILKFFIQDSEWIVWKPKIKDILLKYVDTIVTFSEAVIFEQDNNSSIVLTSPDDSKLIELYTQLCDLLNVGVSNFKPHITLGKVDSKVKAEQLLKTVKPLFLENPINLKLDHLDFLSNRGDVFQIVDSIYKNPILKIDDPLLFIKIFIEEVLCNQYGVKYKMSLVGSRAYQMKSYMTKHPIKSDYDIVVSSSIPMEDFYRRMYGILATTGYVLYCQYVSSHMHILDIILNDINNTELNILYYETTPSDICNIHVHKLSPIVIPKDISPHKLGILNMINVVIIIKKFIKDLTPEIDNMKDIYNLFYDVYILIKRWCRQKKILGANYGYLTGIAVLVMSLKTFESSDIILDSPYKYLLRFIKIFSDYDIWDKPISLYDSQAKVFKSKFPADRLASILTPTNPPDNILRRINKSTIGIIKYELRSAQVMLDNICKKNGLDDQIVKTMLASPRKIEKPYVELEVNHYCHRTAIDITKQISSTIWKLFIKLSKVDPDISWKYKNRKTQEKDGSYMYVYRFNINSEDMSIVCEFLNKYNCSYSLIQ